MSRAKQKPLKGTATKRTVPKQLTPWQPGQSGNPKGRPKGARNRLGTQFLEALEADFNKFGLQAIALVREKKPEVYIKVVADLLPAKKWRPLNLKLIRRQKRFSRACREGKPARKRPHLRLDGGH